MATSIPSGAYTSALGINELSLNPMERHGFNVSVDLDDEEQMHSMATSRNRSHQEFMALAEPHLVPFRAILNLSYTNRAIQAEFSQWLAETRSRAKVEGTVGKPGISEKEGGGRRSGPRTDLKRLTVMRLLHVREMNSAIKIEKRSAKAKDEFLFGEHNETVQWRAAWRDAEKLLQRHFSEIPDLEKPLSFGLFSEVNSEV
jgi:hypothetical protein